MSSITVEAEGFLYDVQFDPWDNSIEDVRDYEGYEGELDANDPRRPAIRKAFAAAMAKINKGMHPTIAQSIRWALPKARK